MGDNTDIEITCPACGQTMKKIFMDEQGVYVDVCLNGCGGVYFDNREYKKVDEKHEDITPLLEAYNGKSFDKVDSSITRICPACEKKMVKHFASSKHEIEMDECYSCGGIFLDFSELERIRMQYETEFERGQAAINELYSKVGDELKRFDEEYEKMKRDNIIAKNRGPLHYVIHSAVFKQFNKLVVNIVKNKTI